MTKKGRILNQIAGYVKKNHPDKCHLSILDRMILSDLWIELHRNGIDATRGDIKLIFNSSALN